MWAHKKLNKRLIIDDDDIKEKEIQNKNENLDMFGCVFKMYFVRKMLYCVFKLLL